MHGRGIGSLYVYQIGEDEEVTRSSKVVFEKHGQQGRDWLEARVDVQRTTTITRVFS